MTNEKVPSFDGFHRNFLKEVRMCEGCNKVLNNFKAEVIEPDHTLLDCIKYLRVTIEELRSKLEEEYE